MPAACLFSLYCPNRNPAHAHNSTTGLVAPSRTSVLPEEGAKLTGCFIVNNIVYSGHSPMTRREEVRANWHVEVEDVATQEKESQKGDKTEDDGDSDSDFVTEDDKTEEKESQKGDKTEDDSNSDSDFVTEDDKTEEDEDGAAQRSGKKTRKKKKRSTAPEKTIRRKRVRKDVGPPPPASEAAAATAGDPTRTGINTPYQDTTSRHPTPSRQTSHQDTLSAHTLKTHYQHTHSRQP